MSNLFKTKQVELAVIKRLKYENNNNRVAAHTRRNLLTIGQQFNSFLHTRKLQLSPSSVKLFLAELSWQQAATTLNLSRQNLKKMLKHQPGICDNYLKRVMVDEIFSDIKPLQVNKSITDYLSLAQVKQLILQSNPATGLMVEFLFKTGCRISELTAIRLQDVKLQESVQIKLIGKGSKQRSVFIDLNLYKRIRSEFKGLYYLFENSRHHQYDRSNLFRQIKAAGKRILKRDIHPHLLRHSTANYLLKDCGKSPKYVSQFLGHSDPAITQAMYIHERPGSEVAGLFQNNYQKGRKIS
jgi:integrase